MFSDLTEFFKAIVRPYVICSAWTVILIMWLNEIDPPELLLGVAGAISLEYIVERAKKRLKGG